MDFPLAPPNKPSSPASAALPAQIILQITLERNTQQHSAAALECKLPSPHKTTIPPPEHKMSQKNLPTRTNPLNPPRRLREGLDEADGLLEDGKPQQALELLTELDQKFPRQPDVLGLMANACFDMKDHPGYLHAIYQLHNLTPNRAEVKMGLAGAYLANGRFALALQTYRQFIKQWPHHERVADAQEALLELEQGLNEMLAEFGFTLENDLDFVCKHEELQVLMEIGQYERCKQLGKNMLAQRPDFVPVINNLGQIHWLEGDLSAAIEMSQKVLALAPDNVHALSNLTRYLFMLGKTEDAQGFAKRLKESTANAASVWIKKIEALGIIVDDEGVLSMLEQAKQAGELDELNAQTWHWCAVAEYRQGNIAQARAHWKKSLKLSPHFEFASDNLEELKKPAYERVCPQVFTSNLWLSRKTLEGLVNTVQRAAARKNEQGFNKEKVCAYMDEHPEIIHFVAAALPWGDTDARKTALEMTEMSAHPKLVAALKDFTLGQAGPDAQRIEASQTLSKLGVLESGQTSDMWIKGGWTPIMTLGFNITREPEKNTLKPAAQRLMEQALDALYADDDPKAESLLRKAIEIQPDDPSLLNNLALALARQGKKAESNALAERVTNDFPDYFFGQSIAARQAIQEKNFEKAREIISRMMKNRELHVSEFGALCACQIDLMLADDKFEGAVTWFEMWKQGYPDDPGLKEYENIMSMFKALQTLKDGFPRSRRKTRKT
jgi:tetratricopeptide (TPR) repeat protein